MSTQIQVQFVRFLENISLTTNQKEDAKRKYTGVCETLHDYFYEGTQYNPDNKYLFGSYKKKTAIRPFTSDQDVDVLFKLSPEEYQRYDSYTSNGQSALLAKIREILAEKYTTTEGIKAWGKVVLIEMAENRHNVELLPAFEQEDGTFIIPNTENGGSWESFDPRSGVDAFFASNDATNGFTRNLSMMFKKWNRENEYLQLNHFEIENQVMAFLESYELDDFEYRKAISEFFEWFLVRCDDDSKSYVETALKRAKKALGYESASKYEAAIDEWQKIFGKEFPTSFEIYKNAPRDHRAVREQYIEDKYPVNLLYNIELQCEGELNGWRKKFIELLPIQNKGVKLTFSLKNLEELPPGYVVKWKVRNFGKEAERADGLRGEIIDSNMDRTQRSESTQYTGEHFVEAYVILNGVCVARADKLVPIN